MCYAIGDRDLRQLGAALESAVADRADMLRNNNLFRACKASDERVPYDAQIVAVKRQQMLRERFCAYTRYTVGDPDTCKAFTAAERVPSDTDHVVRDVDTL